MKRPTLEEVKEYFENADKIKSLHGRKFKNTKPFKDLSSGFYAGNGDYEVWSEAGGYAKILTYKNNDMKLSKEFIKANADKTLKEVFPDVCAPVLEVGKWYNYEKCLINYTGVKDGLLRGYGFLYDNTWTNKTNFGTNTERWTEATNEEVFEALIREAVKRGFADGVYVHSLIHEKVLKISKSSVDSRYIESYDKLHFGCDDSNYVVVYQNGKWATIIETITKEEAEKLLNKKII